MLNFLSLRTNLQNLLKVTSESELQNFHFLMEVTSESELQNFHFLLEVTSESESQNSSSEAKLQKKFSVSVCMLFFCCVFK